MPFSYTSMSKLLSDVKKSLPAVHFDRKNIGISFESENGSSYSFSVGNLVNNTKSQLFAVGSMVGLWKTVEGTTVPCVSPMYPASFSYLYEVSGVNSTFVIGCGLKQCKGIQISSDGSQISYDTVTLTVTHAQVITGYNSSSYGLVDEWCGDLYLDGLMATADKNNYMAQLLQKVGESPDPTIQNGLVAILNAAVQTFNNSEETLAKFSWVILISVVGSAILIGGGCLAAKGYNKYREKFPEHQPGLFFKNLCCPRRNFQREEAAALKNDIQGTYGSISENSNTINCTV